MAAKKKAAKKPAKKAAKKKTARKPNAAFMKPVQPNETLAAIVGANPMPRTELTKKLWAYIKKHGLQDKKNRRAINADEKLLPLFKKKIDPDGPFKGLLITTEQDGETICQAYTAMFGVCAQAQQRHRTFSRVTRRFRLLLIATEVMNGFAMRNTKAQTTKQTAAGCYAERHAEARCDFSP